MMWIGLGILGLLLLLVVGGFIFIKLSPQFGKTPEGTDLERIRKSENYGEDSFVNLIPTTTGNIWEAIKQMPKMMGSGGNPLKPIPADFSDTRGPVSDTAVFITWYGHSAFLIEMDGQRILIDPMLSELPSPLPFGTKRFKYEEEVSLKNLTNIDVMIISHDHYDHLDYPTIMRLKGEVKQFITPLGVGSHLKYWGVDSQRIRELDWWEEISLGPLQFIATPARHFSGRGVSDRDATQWASWVIRGSEQRLYFSGDGGYGPHFKEIGEKYGPFDFAMLECGQYNQAWADIHMMPEQSVEAGLDVNTALAMPIHWGSFRLAPHSWTDPIERFTARARQKSLPYVVPLIGQRFRVGEEIAQRPWWEE